jgi:AcrR family transcriptional regulator
MSERPPLRVRKREQTRLDVVRAAIDLFRENGYDSTTLDAIADRANYSRSTVLRYFGNKEDIAFIDVVDRVRAIGPDLAAFERSKTPYLTLRRFSTAETAKFVDNMTDLHVDCVRLWFEVPALRRRYAELMIDAERLYAEYLADATGAASDDVECQVTAAAIIGVTRVAYNRITRNDPAAVKAAVERGFAVLERGYFKRQHFESRDPVAAASS